MVVTWSLSSSILPQSDRRYPSNLSATAWICMGYVLFLPSNGHDLILSATRMSSIGHMVGYFIGTLDMVSIFGTFLGDTQFKKMTIISAFGLIIAVSVTCWAVTERILISPAFV